MSDEVVKTEPEKVLVDKAEFDQLCTQLVETKKDLGAALGIFLEVMKMIDTLGGEDLKEVKSSGMFEEAKLMAKILPKVPSILKTVKVAFAADSEIMKTGKYLLEKYETDLKEAYGKD